MSFRKLLTTAVVLTGVVAGAAPALAAQGGGGSTTCRKGCTTTSDTTAPTVSLTSPAPGASVPSSFTVTGTAADNVQVTRVDVQVDGGTWQLASGTDSWSRAVSGLSAGSHTLVVRASDAAANTATTSATVSVTSSSTTTTGGSDVALDDPAALYSLRMVGRGRSAEWGTVTGLLYWEESTTRRAMFFRDSATGASSYVTLPADSRTGWTAISYTMTSASDLWVFGGSGPVVLRHYALSGGSVPTTATLVSSEVLGDADSRPGDLLRLSSGAVVASWAQQGASGPQGIWLAYRAAAGAGQLVGPLQFMPSKSTNQALAQHPSDGSLWLFNDPDAWGSIGAAKLTETTAGLSVAWTDAYWIDGKKYGTNRPDPENPDLTAVPDAGRGEIVLAYQSSTRKTFQTSPTVLIGSYPNIARIAASGALQFTTLPVYVERVSDLGLSVSGGTVTLAYHPVDTATMTFDRLQLSTLSGGTWSSSKDRGKLRTAGEWITASAGRVELAAGMSDGSVHLFRPTV
jgi:hypothetical protein